MKRIFAGLIVILVLVLCLAPTAYAEQFEGFSIDFPENFAGAYTSVESDTESDFFTESLSYETKSDYELMRVLIGQSNNLDALFAKDFGFANRQDLDLSLLTEQQLADEAAKLTAYIDMSFPFYMTYVTPKSITVDNRLGLVVTGYYTDFQGNLTGEFRAYEFYYMGQLVILYYDTQIEGTYFVESVFEFPDSIVGTLDFELDPTAKPTNAAWYSEALSAAGPVVGLLAGAILLGILFGLVFKKRPDKQTKDMMTDTSSVSDAPLEPPIKPSTKTEAPTPAPSAAEQPEATQADSSPEPKPVVEEAVDWNAMLKDLRQSTDSAKASAEEEKKQAQPNPAKTAPTPEVTSAPNPKNDDDAQKKTEKIKKIDEAQPVSAPQTSKASADDDNPLVKQLKALDDMSDEISQTLGALQTPSVPLATETREHKKTEVSPDLPQEKAVDKPISPATTPEDLLSELESKTVAKPKPEDAPLTGQPENKSAQEVTNNYQSYMDSLLPSRKKFQKKPEAVDAVPSVHNEPKNDEPEDVVFDLDKQKGVNRDDLDKDIPQRSPKKEKKPGLISRMLTSVAEKIERDEETEPEPEFDSRAEMHISEKTERNSIEKLMPGLFNDEPEEEPVEVLLDQGEDLKFERSKKKPPKTEEERSKLIKNRVDNLFDE